MADTLETLLVGLGLDPESANKVFGELEKLFEDVQKKAKIKAQVEIDAKKAEEELKQTEKDLLDISKILDDISHKGDKIIRIKADTSAFKDFNTQANTLIGNFQSGIDKVSSTLLGLEAVVVGLGASLAAGLGLASKNAADDEVAFRALNNSFGDLTDQAEEFSSKVTDANKALQQGDVQKSLASLNKIGQAFDLSAAKSFEFSTNLVLLASNLSQTTGKGFEEVLDRLQRALLKGGRTAAEFGVIIDKTRIENEAARIGLKGNVDELSDAEEAQIRYNLILAQTGDAATQAATQEATFSQSLKELKTQVSEAFGDLGKQVNAFIQPFVEKMTEAVLAIRKFIDANPGLGKALVEIAVAFAGLATAIGGLLVVLQGASLFLSFTSALIGLPTTIAAITTNFAALGAVLPGVVTAAATLGPVLALIGAAAAGFAAGKLIDSFLGISEAVGKASADATKGKLALEQLNTLNKDTSKEAFLAESAFIAQNTAIKNLTKNGLIQLTVESLHYQQTIAKVIANTEEAAIAQAVYTEAIKDGFTPIQAYAQAMNEQNRLLALAELGTKRTGKQEAEYNAILGRTSDEIKIQLGLMQDLNAAKEEDTKLTKKEQDSLDEWSKKAVAAEHAVEDARVKGTEGIEDDIALIKQRAAEQKKTSPNLQQDAQINRTADAEIQLVKETKAREDAKKKTEEQKKADEERQKAIESATKAAVAAEDAVAEAEAKTTGELDDQLSVLDKREARELGTAKSEQEKTQITRKFSAERVAIIDAEAQKTEDAISKGIEDATKNADSAEQALKKSRAEATDTLDDDIALMKERLNQELALAKSEDERAQLLRKFFAEQKKLIEDNARAQAKADAQKKAALDDFAKAADQQNRTNKGEGAQVSVEQARDSLKKQIPNITDDADLKKFNKAVDDTFANSLQATRQEATDANKAFQDAAAAFDKQKKAGFASTKDRRAAEQEVQALALQAAQKQAILDAAEVSAIKEKAKLEKDAQDALDAQKKKAADDFDSRSQEALDHLKKVEGGQVGAGADAPGAGDNADATAVTGALDSMSAALSSGLSALSDKAASFVAEAAQIATAATALTDLGVGLQSVADAQTGFTESLTNFVDSATGAITTLNDNFNTMKTTLDDHSAQLAALATGQVAADNTERKDAANAGLA